MIVFSYEALQILRDFFGRMYQFFEEILLNVNFQQLNKKKNE